MSDETKWDGTIPEELLPTEDDAEQLARFASFLDSCRGDEAIEAIQATDFRERRLLQAREEAFHRIGLLVREYAATHRAPATPPTPDPRERGERERLAALAVKHIKQFDSPALTALAECYTALRAPAREVTVTEAMVEGQARRSARRSGYAWDTMHADDRASFLDYARGDLTAALTPDAEGGA